MLIRGFTVHSCLDHTVLEGLKNTSNPRDHHLELGLAAEGTDETDKTRSQRTWPDNYWSAEHHSSSKRAICGQVQNGDSRSRKFLTICFKPLAFLKLRNVSCYHGF